MHDIHTRLLQAEDDLLSAFSNGSLDAFQRDWTKLSDDIAAAVQAEQLPDSVQALAHTVASRVHIIASSFLDSDTEYQELATFLQELDVLLEKEQPSDCRATTPKPAMPPYIPLAYTWLLDNLHCPYPSVSMRNSLAQNSGSTRKAIDAWFVDVRKRIGWNALRRSRFSGKKDDIIRAATLFFRGGGGDSALASEFASIELTARELYAEKLRPSVFGSRFAEAVDAFTSRKKDDQTVPMFDQTTVYPSPRSCSSSLPPSPIIPSLPSIPKSTVPSLKRARSVEEVEDSVRTRTRDRPSKRQRLNSRLPSPASSRGTPEPSASVSPQSRHESPSRSPSARYQPGATQAVGCPRDSGPLHQPPREVTGAVGNRSDAGEFGRESIPPLDAALALTPSTTSDPGACPSPSQGRQTSVVERPQVNHRRRCVSEEGPQFPSTLRNKLPRVHSVSDSLSIESIGTVSGWSFDPEVLQSGPGFDSLDDPTNCEVATFDFSTYSPQTLHQGKEPLPIYPSVFDVETIFPQTGVSSNALIVPPSTNSLGTYNSAELSDEGFLSFLNCFPQDTFLSETHLPAFSASPLPNQTGPGMGCGLADIIPNAHESFSWNNSSDVEDMLGSIIQPSVAQELESTINTLSQDEKSKKLKLLAELREAAQRLEAELAVL